MSTTAAQERVLTVASLNTERDIGLFAARREFLEDWTTVAEFADRFELNDDKARRILYDGWRCGALSVREGRPLQFRIT